MKIDQQKIRSALISAVEADKSKTLLGTPSHEAIEIVYLALETQHDLRDVAISNGQASNRFTRWAAAILLRRAYYKGGIDDAMAWLNRILQIQCCDYHIVMPLWGLKLEQSLDLTDQVRILPAKEFSQSENLIRFMRPSVEDLPIYRWQPPSSVLLKRQTFTSVFIKAGEIIEIDWTVIDHLHDMRNCLALAGPVAIAGDNQWIEFIDPDLRDFNSGVWRRAQEIQPHSLDFGSFDPELGKVLIPSFLNLTGKERDRIYLASDRFARALWRNEAGEAGARVGYYS